MMLGKPLLRKNKKQPKVATYSCILQKNNDEIPSIWGLTPSQQLEIRFWEKYLKLVQGLEVSIGRDFGALRTGIRSTFAQKK